MRLDSKPKPACAKGSRVCGSAQRCLDRRFLILGLEVSLQQTGDKGRNVKNVSVYALMVWETNQQHGQTGSYTVCAP